MASPGNTGIGVAQLTAPSTAGVASSAPARHVYVHVPFCERRCTYCNFAIAVRRSVPVDDYVHALAAELRARFADLDPAVWAVDSLYLGGGTPSALGGPGVVRVLDELRRRFALIAGAEVTLEANPEHVDRESAAAWRAGGVTRVSLGAQSFDPRALAWMHRAHSGDRVRQAVDTLRDAGISNLSLDLIFALPRALERPWAQDLATALSLEPPHLSLYGLTVEPGTPLGRWVARGTTVEAPEGSYEREYLAAHDALTGAGYDHYEVSNFGRPGHHACHNQAYWSGVPYVGLGPAAHGFDGAVRRWNREGYVGWRERAVAGSDPVAGDERLTLANRVEETVYLELRTANGTVLDRAEEALVAPWIGAGWARVTDSRLTLTPRGWLRLDSLAVALANVRSR